VAQAALDEALVAQEHLALEVVPDRSATDTIGDEARIALTRRRAALGERR
jgi:hypothetical protein